MKQFISTILFMITMTTSLFSYSATIDEVEEFDIRYYHPENFGLKDLVFEVRFDQMLERLNKQLTFGKLEDIYYKVYWIFPGEYRIEINGLPAGFSEVKNSLKRLVKDRLDFVIPTKLAPKIRGYKLKKKKIKTGELISGRDETGMKAVSEINIKFDKKGRLTEYKTFSPTGTNTAKTKMKVKSWSHNKWVLDEVTSRSETTQIMILKNKITYKSVKGIGLPERVDIETSIKGYTTSNESMQRNKSGITFSKYEVNTGKAQKYILKGLKK